LGQKKENTNHGDSRHLTNLNHQGHLLVASVEITAYNQHCSAPFFRALVVISNQLYSGEGGHNTI
jgi:hypothetical protein